MKACLCKCQGNHTSPLNRALCVDGHYTPKSRPCKQGIKHAKGKEEGDVDKLK